VSSNEAKSDPEAASLVASLPEAAVRPRRMLDRYEIIAEIAKGGMGTVYLARLEGAGGFERLMAIKLMHEHLAEDDTFVTMLLDEARTAANIHHPNAIGISDVVESPVGYFLVMNYVDGFNLAQIVTHPELGETERIRLGARLVADAGHGLHAAHTAKNAKGEKLGIVHRDVSPQNILVGADGTARIVDFGIALAASRVAASRPGTLKGKPQYMAPEQARGEPCDARTDVFALGIILWETLTYERLFFGEVDVAILVQVMDCAVPDVLERQPNAPRALADVAMKALSRWPKDRYATARDFAAALEKAADASGMLASASDVEGAIARIYANELAIREEAVRRHLASSTGPIEPLQKGQMGLVPKLLPKKLAPKTNDLGTRPGREANSGVRERSGEVQPHGPTIIAETGQSAPIAAVQRVEAAAPAPVAEKPALVAAKPAEASPGRLGIALGVGGALLLAVAAAVWAMSARETPPPTPVSPPWDPVTVAEPPPVDVALPEPVVVAPEPVAPVEPIAPAVEPAPPVEAAHHEHRRRTPPPTLEAPAPPELQVPPAHDPHAPAIETNPYLTH
jgi:serine/threonine protein kinase